MQWARISMGIFCCWCHHLEEEQIAKDRFAQFDLIAVPSEFDWDNDRDYIDPTGVAKDRLWLEEQTAETFQLAQRMVAHRTPKRDMEVSFTTLNESIDAILLILRKYYLLITGEPLAPKRIRPARNFRHAFMQPWLPESNRTDQVA